MGIQPGKLVYINPELETRTNNKKTALILYWTSIRLGNLDSILGDGSSQFIFSLRASSQSDAIPDPTSADGSQDQEEFVPIQVSQTSRSADESRLEEESAVGTSYYNLFAADMVSNPSDHGQEEISPIRTSQYTPTVTCIKAKFDLRLLFDAGRSAALSAANEVQTPCRYPKREATAIYRESNSGTEIQSAIKKLRRSNTKKVSKKKSKVVKFKEDAVGKLISILYPNAETWYNARVVRYDSNTDNYKLVYVDVNNKAEFEIISLKVGSRKWKPIAESDSRRHVLSNLAGKLVVMNPNESDSPERRSGRENRFSS